MKQSLPSNSYDYTVIAIYGGKEEGSDAISHLDGTPGYLHIHIIRKDILANLPVLEFANTLETKKSQTIYQWGSPIDKDLAIRKPVATIKDIVSYGDVGIGSAAIGGEEEKSSFVGGGEVFIVPCFDGIKAFRITKGQGVFPLNLDDQCWTCEVTNSTEAFVIPVEKQKISGRTELLRSLQKAHNMDKSIPFIAQFDANFDKEHLAVRSNGLWPNDLVEQRNITLFDATTNSPVGGHLLGDSNSEGDQLNKHKGQVPTSGAAVSLILEGVVRINVIKERLIALKEDPHQFRAPLLHGDLATALKSTENHRPILINGGGIAGTTTALKLAKLGIPCTIIDQREKLLSETSGCTPARVGHGYHYRDLETAKLYLQSSITFLKEYCKNPDSRTNFIIRVSETTPELDCGLYFIRKDSQVAADELLQIYEGIRTEYKRLIELDPSNKIFGEAENFFEVLNLEDYKDTVDISKMAAVLRTQERLLNWPNFSEYLLQQIDLYQKKNLISVMNQEEVTKIEYNEKEKNRGFKVMLKSGKIITTSHIVNATWSSIEMLDSDLFPEAVIEERTNRMKLIASVSLTKDQQSIPSIFTAMGPYTMFSNEGNGRGKMTYAPVTNMLDYVIEEFKKTDEASFDLELREIFNEWRDNKEIIIDSANNPELWRDIECELTIPSLYKRWLAEGLNEKEKSFFGKKILEGVVAAYPALSGAELIGVAGGIVKSNGEVNIRKTDSQFHERTDHGLKKRQIGYSDFNGVKLFYGESQSRCVVENIVSDISSNILIEKLVTDSEITNKNEQNARELTLHPFVRRYSDQRSLNNGHFSQLSSKPSSNIAYQATISNLREFLSSNLNLYLQEPQSTHSSITPFVRNIIRPIGDVTKTIINESNSFDENRLEEWQEITKKNFSTRGFAELFTIFSVIDSAGTIIFDGKYGLINEEKREKYEIPSLQNRDYVQEMMHNKHKKFVCGSAVIGSTSKEFMIPIGINLNASKSLTFGMSVTELMKILPKLLPEPKRTGYSATL